MKVLLGALIGLSAVSAAQGNTGNVCTTVVNQVRYYSVMPTYQPVGTRCFVQNQRFQPLFEGVVVQSIQRETRNVQNNI